MGEHDYRGAHPSCWKGDHYEHDCHRPSERPCVDCGSPAGTPWGPYWCPDCDVKRLDAISASLDDIELSLSTEAAHG